MPGGECFGDDLEIAVEKGSVPKERVDDMVKRMLWAMFSVKLFDEQQRRNQKHTKPVTLDDPVTR